MYNCMFDQSLCKLLHGALSGAHGLRPHLCPRPSIDYCRLVSGRHCPPARGRWLSPVAPRKLEPGERADTPTPHGTGYHAPAWLLTRGAWLDEWWARELAGHLEISRNRLFYWIEHGLVRARKECGGWQRWIVWADTKEMERLRAYRDRDIAGEQRRRWTAVRSSTAHQQGATA